MTDLLAEKGKIRCKPISTPMDPNHKLGEAKEEPMVDKIMCDTPNPRDPLTILQPVENLWLSGNPTSLH